MSACVAALACGDTHSDTPATADSAAHADTGGHEHKAPHGGTLLELGDEAAHLELVLNRDDGTLTAYVLDAEAEQAVRIADSVIRLDVDTGATAGTARMVVDLLPVASTLTGEKAGDTSEFRATVPALKGAPKISGTVRALTARGLTFRDVAFTLTP